MRLTKRLVPRWCLLSWILFNIYFSCLSLLVYCLVCSLQLCDNLLRKGWPLGYLVWNVFLCFVTFPYGVSGQVWYLIVSIPDLCFLLHFCQYANSLHGGNFVQRFAVHWFCGVMFLIRFYQNKILKKYHASVIHFGSRSDLTNHLVSSGSKLCKRYYQMTLKFKTTKQLKLVVNTHVKNIDILLSKLFTCFCLDSRSPFYIEVVL